MGLGDYLRILDWTGRQLRRDQRGAIAQDLRPILERLGSGGESWGDGVRTSGRSVPSSGRASPWRRPKMPPGRADDGFQASRLLPASVRAAPVSFRQARRWFLPSYR